MILRNGARQILTACGNRRWMLVLFAILLFPAGLAGCAIMAAGAAAGAAGGLVASRDIGVRKGASVRVDFVQPQDIGLTIAPRSEVTVVRNVQSLVGHAERVRGDTVWLVVSEAWAGTNRERYRRNQARVLITLASTRGTVTPLADRAAYVTTGALAGTALATVVIIVICLMEPCMQ